MNEERDQPAAQCVMPRRRGSVLAEKEAEKESAVKPSRSEDAIIVRVAHDCT